MRFFEHIRQNRGAQHVPTVGMEANNATGLSLPRSSEEADNCANMTHGVISRRYVDFDRPSLATLLALKKSSDSFGFANKRYHLAIDTWPAFSGM